MNIANEAWNCVTQATIRNYFRMCRFENNEDDNMRDMPSATNISTPTPLERERMCSEKGIAFDEFINVDVEVYLLI